MLEFAGKKAVWKLDKEKLKLRLGVTGKRAWFETGNKLGTNHTKNETSQTF